MKLIKRLFAKLGKDKSCEQDIYKMILPSVIGICICAVCLVGGTFAWFTGTSTTAAQVIQSANYTVSSVVNKDGEAIIAGADGAYTLKEGTYTVKITAGGTASTGYALLRYEDKEEHTAQIAPGASTELTISVTKDTSLKVIGQWGISSRNVQ